jgi:hypothetical protein
MSVAVVGDWRGPNMTRLQELEKAADSVGLYVRTYSPGGVGTNYKFFEKMSRDCKCGHPFHHHNKTDYHKKTARDCWAKPCQCKRFHALPSNSSYFGPEQGIANVNGLKAAWLFLQGRGAV